MSFLPSFHLSVRCHSVWKSFRFSFHAFYEWTGEQKARERRKGVASERRAAAGEHRLNDCSFQRVICPALTHYPDSLMSRSRIRFGGYIHGMTGRGRSGL